MLTATSVIATTVLALALPAFAADPNNASAAAKPVLDQLLEESRVAKKSASELAAMLKSKNADLSKAAEQIAQVEKSQGTIKELMAKLEGEATQWDSRRKASVEQARKVTEVMGVFVENKKDIAEAGIDAENRERLRMNAVGVAQRAELLEKTLAKL
jgi:septal ring factor EnvC (AmiA/AmiB activator)